MQVLLYVRDQKAVHRQQEQDTVLHRNMDISKIEPFEFLDRRQWNLSIHQDHLELIEGTEFKVVRGSYGPERTWRVYRLNSSRWRFFKGHSCEELAAKDIHMNG